MEFYCLVPSFTKPKRPNSSIRNWRFDLLLSISFYICSESNVVSVYKTSLTELFKFSTWPHSEIFNWILRNRKLKSLNHPICDETVYCFASQKSKQTNNNKRIGLKNASILSHQNANQNLLGQSGNKISIMNAGRTRWLLKKKNKETLNIFVCANFHRYLSKRWLI